MIGDLIDNFRFTVPAVNRKISKVELRQVFLPVLILKILVVSHSFLDFAILQPNVVKN